jgi:predicted nucleic acid-binding Zn ribbon protein
MKPFQSVRVAQLIPGVLAAWKKQLESPLEAIGVLWSDVVGKRTAAHTVPAFFCNRILTISVDSPVWASELATFHSERILQKLNAALGSHVVEELRFTTRGD